MTDIKKMLDEYVDSIFDPPSMEEQRPGETEYRAAILAEFESLKRARDQYRNDALGLTTVIAQRDARIAKLEQVVNALKVLWFNDADPRETLFDDDFKAWRAAREGK